MNAKEILKEMTLEEKASLCSGKEFWTTKAVERLGIPSYMMTDGPHGLRKQTDESDHIGLNDSVLATCFPTACTTASSWNPELIGEMGKALAEECQQEKVSVILGPGANIKRSPLCGRNFEYFSEDPALSGKMAAGYINGVQSKAIGTSLKHYAMNNQEARRMTIDAVVDERAQREIYLSGFEIAVKEAQPWTVMCSYNRVDGTYLSEHKKLLTDILKNEWGHKGIVVTDWGACNDRVEGIKAGLELEMPSSNGKNDEKIINAVKAGTLSEEDLDKAVIKLIDLALKANKHLKPDYKYSIDAHRALARKIAGDSIVLLKNDNILPLKNNTKIAVIGEFAKKPRYQGAGSSIISPHKIDNLCECLDEQKIKYEYAKGYNIKSSAADTALIAEAVAAAQKADVVVLIAGLTPDFESEGFDRTNMNMPESHNALIEAVIKANKNVVIVLQNGSPVSMPWLKDVKAVIESYLGGEAGSGAIADVLYGKVNPSGKLAETFPLKIEDTSCCNYFPGSQKTVEYRASIYVGYRYYDKAQKDVLFPFGFGLSYTDFEYSGLSIKKLADFEYEVNLKVKNTGKIAGAEVVQLYVKNNESKIFKAVKELRAFDKVYLKANEEKTIKLMLDKRAFSYYNTEIADWHVDDGTYGILIGASSRDIRLKQEIKIKVSDEVTVPDLQNILPSYYKLPEGEFKVSDSQFEKLLGRKIPPSTRSKEDPYDLTTSLGDIKDKFVGKQLIKIIKKKIQDMVPVGEDDDSVAMSQMVESTVLEMPIRAFSMLGGDSVPKYFGKAILELLNGRLFRAIGMITKK